MNNTRMKHMNIFQSATGLFFCLLLLSSCAKDEVDTMGDIHGIVSGESGIPIQVASVTLTPTGKTTTTGDDGRFEFNDLEPQQYTISVTKVGYASNSKTLTIRAGETSKGDLILVKGLPQLKINVTELVFDDADDILSFEISNSGSGLLEWQVKEEADWISLEPAHGQTGKGISTVSVRINRTGLSPDVEHVYTLNIISTSGGAKEVKVRVRAKTPKILVIAPLQLKFSADKIEEYLTIEKKSGEGNISYSLSADREWVLLGGNVSGEIGEKETKIKVSVVRAGLAPGTRHTANITLLGDDDNNIVIPVIMDVETVPLEVNLASLDFSADDSSLSFTLKNPTEIPVNYTISKDASWLSLSRTSGMLNVSEESIAVTVLREGLSVGTHKATINITAPGSRSITIPVSVTVEVVESYESVMIASCDPRIRVEIVNCRRSGTAVVLNYTIKNTGIENDIPDFRIYPAGGMLGQSGIYDNNGKQYTYTTITLGTAFASDQAVQGSLPFGVKVSGSITIKNFSATASRLSLVKMECLAYPNSIYNLADKFFTFRDVPIY